MTIHALIYTLHLLCALIWVGGMFFAWMILRPAAVSTLQAPARLGLWSDVLPRFFRWVWLAVVILPLSGFGMLHLRQQTIETAPHFIQVMIGLYLVMLSLFLRAQLLELPALRKSVAAEDWTQGGAALARIRRLVGFNLLIGMTLVGLAAARPTF
ncbi:CopD family protein [Pseudomonas sp. N040]|uniref:CopD family protein n=1 Tax=Pseudomonas sp. N040 TaxID=2785325 RepID=UPI0018A330F4|nr:CopD family protein [Pseudomonas sp. N040]MBF7730581.1 CopD family protein [Pseudomonas sp. N040]MBW7014225.1 CopD family protein [Pseudomonas sp. N040]